MLRILHFYHNSSFFFPPLCMWIFFPVSSIITSNCFQFREMNKNTFHLLHNFSHSSRTLLILIRHWSLYCIQQKGREKTHQQRNFKRVVWCSSTILLFTVNKQFCFSVFSSSISHGNIIIWQSITWILIWWQCGRQQKDISVVKKKQIHENCKQNIMEIIRREKNLYLKAIRNH